MFHVEQFEKELEKMEAKKKLTLRVTGVHFATFNEVKVDFLVDLTQDVDFSIKHNEEFTCVTINDFSTYCERGSVGYEVIEVKEGEGDV